MKIIYYDLKHQQILDKLNVGDISDKEKQLLQNVIDFLYGNLILDGRYKCMSIEQDAEVKYIDDEPQVILYST